MFSLSSKGCSSSDQEGVIRAEIMGIKVYREEKRIERKIEINQGWCWPGSEVEEGLILVVECLMARYLMLVALPAFASKIGL